MYPYEEWEEKDIVGFRNIIELMINKGYGWTNADGNIYQCTKYINILIMYSNIPPANVLWITQTVSFGYDSYPHSWCLYPLEEVKKNYFWQWLEANWYLIRPRKNIDEHVFSIKDKTIWEVARYVRENVLVRNVKLFQ